MAAHGPAPTATTARTTTRADRCRSTDHAGDDVRADHDDREDDDRADDDDDDGGYHVDDHDSSDDHSDDHAAGSVDDVLTAGRAGDVGADDDGHPEDGHAGDDAAGGDGHGDHSGNCGNDYGWCCHGHDCGNSIIMTHKEPNVSERDLMMIPT